MNHSNPLSRSSTPSPSFSSGSSSYHASPTPSPTAIGYQQHRAYPTITHTMAPYEHEHGHRDTLCNNQPEHDVDFDRRTFLQMDFGTGSDIDLDINFDSDGGQLDLGLDLRTLGTTLSSTKPLQRLYSPSEITFDVNWTPLRDGVNVGVCGDKEGKEEDGSQSQQGRTRSRGNNGRMQVDMDTEVGPYGHERGRRSGTTSAEGVSQVQTQAPVTATASAMSVNTSTAAVEDWDIDEGCDDFYRREPVEDDLSVGLLSTMRPHPFKASAFVGSSSSSVGNWQQCRRQRQRQRSRQDSSASHPYSHSHSYSTHIKTTHMRTMLEELLPGARGSLALQFEALSSRVALLGLDGVDEGVGVSEGVERLLLEDPRAAWAELCFEEAAPEEDEQQMDASSVSRVSASPVLMPSIGVPIVSNSDANHAASVSKWPHTLTTQAQVSNARPLPPLPPLPQQLPPLPTQAHPSHIHEGLYAVDGIRTWASSPLLPYSTRPPSLAMPPPYSARDGHGDGDDEIVGFGSVFGYEGSLCLGAEGEEIRRTVFGVEDEVNARRESTQTQSQSQASTPRTPTINLQGTIAESNDHTFGHALSSDARRQSVPISYAESFLSSEESSMTTTASQSAPSLASGSSLAPSPSPSSSCGSLSYSLSLTNEMKGSMLPPEADIVNTLTIVGAWGEVRSQTDSYPHTRTHTHTRARSHSRNRTSSTPKLSSKTVLDRAEAIARIYGPTPIDPSDPNTNNSNNWHLRSYPHNLRECGDDSSLVGRERAKARLRAFLDAGDGGVNGADSGVPPGLDLEFERAWSGEGGGDVVPGLGLTSDSDPGHDTRIGAYAYAYGRHSQHHANETKQHDGDDDDDLSRQRQTRLPAASRTRSLPGPYLLSLPRGINSHPKSGENECEGDGGDGDDRDEYKHKDPHLQIRVSAFVTSPSSPPPTHLRHYHHHDLLSDSNADTHSRACAQTAHHHVHNPYPYPHAYTHTHAITGSPPSSRILIAPPKSSHLVVLPPVVKPDEGIGYAPVRKEKGSGTTLLRIANGLGMRWR